MLYFACHAGQVTFFKCSVSGPGAYFNFFLPCRPGHFLFDCLVSGTGNFFLIYLVSGLGINEPGFLFWLNPKVPRAYACVHPRTCIRKYVLIRMHDCTCTCKRLFFEGGNWCETSG